jgi:hypothetical protein
MDRAGGSRGCGDSVYLDERNGKRALYPADAHVRIQRVNVGGLGDSPDTQTAESVGLLGIGPGLWN